MLALDLDGPVLDPEPRQTAVLRFVLTGESAASKPDPAEVWALKREGLSTHSALARLGMTDDAAGRVARRWTEGVEDPRWLALDALQPGAAEALAQLARDGTRSVILTARRHPDRVHAQVDSIGLLRWCTGLRLVSPDDATQAKAVELRAIRASAFIGDTESDAEAASIADVPFAGVSNGQRSGDFLEARGVRTFASLGDAIRSLGS